MAKWYCSLQRSANKSPLCGTLGGTLCAGELGSAVFVFLSAVAQYAERLIHGSAALAASLRGHQTSTDRSCNIAKAYVSN